MIRLTYAPDLIEAAVLLAERTAPGSAGRAFRRERDRLYEIPDADLREASFRSLHLQWFGRLGLERAIERVVRERADVVQRVSGGRVLRALTRDDEGADLAQRVTPAGARGAPTLILRLRPATLVEPEILRALLHHELTHVADMLDPAFGYERSLPASEAGPSADNILRDRYRVLWDVTIDGRLARAGLVNGSMRDIRWREFAATYAMLGDRCRSAFERWFDEARPTHAELVAFATAPARAAGSAGPGRCPLCRFPVASLDQRVETLSAPTLAAIRANHPGWRLTQGLCAQCLDLYEARAEDRPTHPIDPVRPAGPRRSASSRPRDLPAIGADPASI